MSHDKERNMADKERSEGAWLRTASLVILAVVALGFALTYTRAVMVPFVLALFIVSIVSPILDFQVLRLRFPRFLAVTVTLVFVMIIIGLTCLLVTQTIHSIVLTAGDYSSEVQTLALKAYDRYTEYRSRFEGQDEATDVHAQPADSNARNVSQAARNGTLQDASQGTELARTDRPDIDQWSRQWIRQSSQGLLNLLRNTVGMALQVVSGTVFVMIFVIFLLAGRNPRSIRTGVYADVDQKIRRYVGIKLVISAITGLLVWLSLRVIGLELAGVFGILAFLLNFIPSIGSVIAVLLPIPMAVAQFQDGLWPIVLVILFPSIIQIVIGNIIDPKLMGEGLNLHPVTILLALSFWGLLWGIVGMFLAAPMTAVIRIVLMQFDTLQPIGRLLAGQLPNSKDHR